MASVYIGLPLALQFARSGANVVGLDIDKGKLDRINAGESYIKHITAEAIGSELSARRLRVSDNMELVEGADAVIICVPPLNKNREPDISFIIDTARQIGPHLSKGTLVVLESTTYPGTTDEDLRVVLEETLGMVAGREFNLAFSPEREDPGNPNSVVATNTEGCWRPYSGVPKESSRRLFGGD